MRRTPEEMVRGTMGTQLRRKSIEELEKELELIDRTIQALENLGRLRVEPIAEQASLQRRGKAQENATLSPQKVAAH